MIIGRHRDSELNAAKNLPQDWTEEFVSILSHSYSERANEDNCFFDVHGLLFDDEVVALISYIDHNDHLKSPITVSISLDIQGDIKKMGKALDQMVDLTGLIFDDIFATKEWSGYIQNWTENKYKGFDYHYKITRENFSLTLQAEAILNDSDVLN
jgi:hypothetical protein